MKQRLPQMDYTPDISGTVRVLAVTGNLLFPGHDGGSQHILSLLEGFVRAGCHVTYLPLYPHKLETFSGSLEEAVQLLATQSIHVAFVPNQSLPLAVYLAQYGQTIDYVLLWPENLAIEHYPTVKEYAPQAKVIFSPIDLAHVRLFRQAKIKPGLPVIQSAIQAKRREVWLANHCDVTLLVSEQERQTLLETCPAADIRVIPSVWNLTPPGKPFAERNGLVFVGSFPYEANVDAVLYFVNAVYPLICRSLGDVAFNIVGAAPPPTITALAVSDKRIVVTGQVPSVEPYFERARVCIAPIRYGAGIKTKILYSISCGLPVVTSTIGAEGLFLQDGGSALIADDALEFADATIRLYQDEGLWSRLAQQGKSVVEEHFSIRALDTVLDDLIHRVPSRQPPQRVVTSQAGGPSA